MTAERAKERTYERKISASEAREGRIMVTAGSLDVFPPVGQEFLLSHGSRRQTAGVEAESCACRGEQKPHTHYYIRWPGLKAGQVVRISGLPTDGGYDLEIDS